MSALALLVTAGCAAFGSDAPLEEAGGGEYCATRPADGRLSFGAGFPRNRSGEDVEVTDVQLVDPVGMELLGANVGYVSTEGSSDAVGALDGWPPAFDGDAELEAWFARTVPLEGAVIPPSKKTEPAITIGVRAEPGARSGPLKFTYRSGDDEWTWTGAVTFRVGGADGCGA